MRLKKYVCTALFCALLVAGMPSSALAESKMMAIPDYSSYSISQLEALITKLQRQLEELKKGSPCFVSEHELSLGDGEGDDLSEDVRRLQNFLNEKGLFPYKSTGYFGKVTRASVTAFQKREGLNQTGAFDGGMREHAHKMYCKKPMKAVKYEEKKREITSSSSPVSSISLKASGPVIVWAVSGYSKHGFKVVWSKNPTPTYPTRDGDRYQYFDNPMQAESKLEAFDGSGVYYVRVCEYLGGACGVYSNEVKVEL